MVFFYIVESVVMSSLTFQVVVICVFSLFFLIVLNKGLSILFNLFRVFCMLLIFLGKPFCFDFSQFYVYNLFQFQLL